MSTVRSSRFLRFCDEQVLQVLGEVLQVLDEVLQDLKVL